MLVDRRTERSAVDSLIASARGGLGSALVLHGEPGIGKTALLEYVIESASGFRVARAAGVESEMELAYAALHQVCGPMLGWLDRLPGPQRDALGVAFGLRAGESPDRFLVGLAVLNLLSEVAGERPLLCVVDDVQWLDRASAQALAFAARRLLAEPVALIFATREPAGEFTGLPDQLVQGLGDTDARALLGSFLRVPLDERVCDQIVAETWGNPLALLELPRGLTPEDLAGGFGVLSAPGLPGRIEESFLRRCQALPAAVRQLLLVVAAEPAGDLVLVWRAAGRLGITRDAAAAAEAEELLVTGTRVMFRHPLVRSAVYRAASGAGRGGCQVPGRRVRRGAGTAGDRGGGTAGQTPACPGGPAARPVRVSIGTHTGCSVVAAQGGPAIRVPRSWDGAGDLPGRSGRSAIHGPPGQDRRRAGGGGGRALGAGLAAARAGARPAAGRPGAADYLGLRRGYACAQPGAARLP
jgi:hypothetical protein